jgi:hypothetical protein
MLYQVAWNCVWRNICVFDWVSWNCTWINFCAACMVIRRLWWQRLCTIKKNVLVWFWIRCSRENSVSVLQHGEACTCLIVHWWLWCQNCKQNIIGSLKHSCFSSNEGREFRQLGSNICIYDCNATYAQGVIWMHCVHVFSFVYVCVCFFFFALSFFIGKKVAVMFLLIWLLLK